VEVAEKRVFFRWKWLKNVCFSGGSGWKLCVFWAEVAEKRAFFRWKSGSKLHWLWPYSGWLTQSKAVVTP
jgi:hypothetical protein